MSGDNYHILFGLNHDRFVPPHAMYALHMHVMSFVNLNDLPSRMAKHLSLPPYKIRFFVAMFWTAKYRVDKWDQYKGLDH